VAGDRLTVCEQELL